MVEDTRVHSTFVDPNGRTEEKEIEILAQVDVGENVRKPGSDVKQGDLVLEKGTLISSGGGEIGTLAFVGKTKVGSPRVFPMPAAKFSILHSGSSLSQTGSRYSQHWQRNK